MFPLRQGRHWIADLRRHTANPGSLLKNSALMLRQAQHERESPCRTMLSAHPEPVEGRADSLFQRAAKLLAMMNET
jgi:hypothetical protein